MKKSARISFFFCHFINFLLLLFLYYVPFEVDKTQGFVVSSTDLTSLCSHNHRQLATNQVHHHPPAGGGYYRCSRYYNVNSPFAAARTSPQIEKHRKRFVRLPKFSSITRHISRKRDKRESYRRNKNQKHQNTEELKPQANDKENLRVNNRHSRAKRRVKIIFKKFGLNQLVKRWKAVSFQNSNMGEWETKVSEELGNNHQINYDSNSSVQSEPSLIPVTNIQELHKAILFDRHALKDIIHRPGNDTIHINNTRLLSHPVLSLIAQRVKDKSTPSNRPFKDKAILSLSIEGGGMRGAVSAGMAAAIVSLGLVDVFDSVYGSSAGSIVGAYMISRQMCVDVYTEILVAAKEIFVCKKRMLTSLIYSAATEVLRRSSDTLTALGDTTIGHASITWTKPISQRLSTLWANSSFFLPNPKLNNQITIDLRLPELQLAPPMPGMNLTFVVEGIMNNRGLRPLDWESFLKNDAKQPLHIVSSTVREGQIETVTFSSRDGDFGNYPPQSVDNSETTPLSTATKKQKQKRRIILFRNILTKSRRNHKKKRIKQSESSHRYVSKLETFCYDQPEKRGLLACLEASMNVPGAVGPPLKLLRSMHHNDMALYNSSSMDNINNITIGFDAFCYEPIPYRSAVKDGSTHVLALRSRPEGFLAGTQPTIYERLIAPLYFYANDLPQVARFFERGGQQYRYLEDLLVLQNGLNVGTSSKAEPVSVPPTDILYGLDNFQHTNIDDWNKAHLYPLSLPNGATELSTISTERDEVLQAVRDGYAVAFDLLAPIAGLDLESLNMTGGRVAELVFPDQNGLGATDVVLRSQILVKGEEITQVQKRKRIRIPEWLMRRKGGRTLRKLANLFRHKQRFLLGRTLSSGFTTRDRSRPVEVLTYMKQHETDLLLSSLPGFQLGKFPHLSKHLRA